MLADLRHNPTCKAYLDPISPWDSIHEPGQEISGLGLGCIFGAESHHGPYIEYDGSEHCSVLI